MEPFRTSGTDTARTPGTRASQFPATGRQRPVISGIRPRVRDGIWPPKAAVGDVVLVEADILLNGPEKLCCNMSYIHRAERIWHTVAMIELGNDRWRAELYVTEVGMYRFVIGARADSFATWKRDLRRRFEAGQNLTSELLVGAGMLWDAAARAGGGERRSLAWLAERLRRPRSSLSTQVDASSFFRAHDGPVGNGNGDGHDPALATIGSLVFSEELEALLGRFPEPGPWAQSEVQRIYADRELARFGAWYEMFPRSTSGQPGCHGTFADLERLLPYVAELGFDVLYLPPIHPIGYTNRKGPAGAPVAGPSDPGSPWAIGSAQGGHTAIHPELGTLEDFQSLLAAARDLGIEVALDLAFQASPDHPWVSEHVEWFRRGPGGGIAYAENPPKRYEDIYPLNFDTPEWQRLWSELLGVARFWISQGVKIFRVDNPHTKPFAFWEWFISVLKADHPDLILLSEAFTRPKIMYELAKVGFTQSYTYFAWRNTKSELESYMTELTATELADFFRPNLWPNTPDILTPTLQSGSTAAFVIRLVLAATLGASYGIYGPAFELMEHKARELGSEEYEHSEKYEVRFWEREHRPSLAGLIARINAVRREHPALQHNRTLRFLTIDNEQMIAYVKLGVGAQSSDAILVVVNLDPVYTQSGWLDFQPEALGLTIASAYVMHDLLTEARYHWAPGANFVRLDPGALGVHVLCVEAEHSAELSC
ncbi:MAG: maltotransferase domain-containing protein [Acidimicrobiales bacterium]